MTEGETTDFGGSAGAISRVACLRVLVVDDELAGMDRSHLDSLDPMATESLGDPDSPASAEVMRIAAALFDATEYEGDGHERARFLASNEVVEKVLVTPNFREAVSAEVRPVFSNFLARLEHVEQLKAEIRAAFPSPCEVEFVSVRPAPSEILTYNFVILDLVLKGAASPVDDLATYLRKVSDAAVENRLPPIVLMSTAREELLHHRRTFSEKAGISAAGLWILPKADLLAADFKAAGLRIVFDQLVRQSSAANAMRHFMRRWTAAQRNAVSRAETTFWNLDAAALQRLHHTALKDNDPFDGQLAELFGREYLWHIESDAEVGKAVAELDTSLREQVGADDPVQLAYRFMSPVVDPEVMRTLFSHFTWTGWPTLAFYGAGVPQPAQVFNTTLPFGAVLARDLADGAECLVHITQQCDLNAASRPTPEERSAVFATAVAHEALAHHVPRFDSQDLVARGLREGAREFDLKFVPGRSIAMPVADFLRHAEERKLKVVGRLRYDIAVQFVQATANQLTRPASFVMARESSFEAKVFLVGAKFPVPGPTAYLDGDQKKGRIVKVGRESSMLTFQDDDSVRIAIWLDRMLTAHYGAGLPAVDALSNRFRLGVKTGETLSPNVVVDLHFGTLDKAFLTIKGIKTEANDPIVKLILVADSSVKF